MKFCPHCRTSYTDDSLSFCLTDGSPLLEGGVRSSSPSSDSSSWQDAVTVTDFTPPSHSQTSTTQNISAPSIPDKQSIEFKLRQTNPLKLILYTLAVSAVGLSAIGGAIYYFSQKTASRDGAASSINSTSVKITSNPNIAPALAEQIKNESVAHISSWIKTNENRDIEAHLAHYTPTVKTFYKDSDVDIGQVRLQRQRAYDRFQKISLNVGNVEIFPQSDTEVIARFDKTWVFEGAAKFSSGSVKQELHLTKGSGKWLIDGEKDLEVNYINNRATQDGAR